MPKINDPGLALIKRFEGCRLQAYQDAVGVWTIGFGHTPSHEGDSITIAQANALLEDDVQHFADGVNALLARSIDENQFSALVSFSYNVGLEALRESTLLHLVNAGNFSEAEKQFSHWVYAGGKVLPGLVLRRAAEAELFAAKVTSK